MVYCTHGFAHIRSITFFNNVYRELYTDASVFVYLVASEGSKGVVLHLGLSNYTDDDF